MLDSRYLSSNRRPQALATDFYTTRIIIMRKKIVGLSDPFSGDMGENEIEFDPVVRGWPASIAPVHEDTKMAKAGQTVKASYVLTCPYRATRDGQLLVRERDIVIDMSNQQRLLVVWAHDPMNTRTHIVAGVEFGTVNYDLDRQG
jgi:hypothetical protein